jgi:hypothetical protein
MAPMDSSIWSKIKKWFSKGKIIVIGSITLFVLITAAILNAFAVWDRLFPHEDVVFRTIHISPDPKSDTYPLCILPGPEILPVTSPLPDENTPTEMFGGLSNIAFTVTNNTQHELLVDNIEATLIQYESMPDKCIYTSGPMAMLVPIDLLLILSPEQTEYDLLRGKYLSISSGKTEHVFKVYVAGREPGVYRFKIRLRCRIGGEIDQVVESDATYSFVVRDMSKCAECSFFYKADQCDPAFEELSNIVNKPLDEFKQTTSNWHPLELIDCLHNAPQGLKDFIVTSLSFREDLAGSQTLPGLDTRDASELVLSTEDITLELASIPELVVSTEDLPDWILNIGEADTKVKPISAFTVKYAIKYAIQSLTFDCVLYNTVAVYPTVEIAQRAYFNTIPQDRQLFRMANTEIGDEYYMATGQSTKDIMTILVFRRGNIVVSLVKMPSSYSFQSVGSYAHIIENKL